MIRTHASAVRLWRDTRGASVIIFALTLPVLAVMATGAVQYASLLMYQTTLQKAADAAALGAATQLNLASTMNASASAAALFISSTNIGHVPEGVSDSVTATVLDNNTGVDVTIVRTAQSLFGTLLGPSMFSVRAHAQAHALGGAPICAIALDGKVSGAVTLDTSAVVDARGCAVYSNSKNDWSIYADQSAVLQTIYTCAVGGKKGYFPNFNPQPKTGCPPIADPLASRPAPTIPYSCLATDLVVSNSTVTLNPGAYCGGLKITAGAQVTLNPGEYVISGGPLVVDQGASLTGINVGFYLTKYAKAWPPLPKSGPGPGPATSGPAPGTTIYFAQNSTISLTAPTSGALAGLLFFEDPTLPKNQLHQILSNNAQTLLGTIYLPQGRLFVGSTAPVAANSAYTIIVADTVELSAGPTLVLNSNYTATDVPVPKGVGPQDGTVTLTQ